MSLDKEAAELLTKLREVKDSERGKLLAEALEAAHDDGYGDGQDEARTECQADYDLSEQAGRLVIEEAERAAEELHHAHDDRWPLDTCQRSECQALRRLFMELAS